MLLFLTLPEALRIGILFLYRRYECWAVGKDSEGLEQGPGMREGSHKAGALSQWRMANGVLDRRGKRV